VDYAPVLRKAAKDQSENAMGRLAAGHGEGIFAAGEGGIAAPHFNAEIAEFQPAHRAANALVVLAVALERGLPAPVTLPPEKNVRSSDFQ
jgi:hypothetical protein